MERWATGRYERVYIQFARVITHKPRNFRRRRNISLRLSRTLFLNALGELRREDKRSVFHDKASLSSKSWKTGIDYNTRSGPPTNSKGKAVMQTYRETFTS